MKLTFADAAIFSKVEENSILFGGNEKYAYVITSSAQTQWL